MHNEHLVCFTIRVKCQMHSLTGDVGSIIISYYCWVYRKYNETVTNGTNAHTCAVLMLSDCRCNYPDLDTAHKLLQN